jgi:membrane associated rhomboid family serine protease
VTLEDRDYMRGPTKHRDMVWTPQWSSAVIWLVIAHAALTLVSLEGMRPSRAGLALVPALVFEGEWWRLFTAPFCSNGYLALLATVLMIWGLGRHVEYERGSRGLLTLYVFGSGVAVAVALVVAAVADQERLITTVSLPACMCLLLPGLDARGYLRVLGLPNKTFTIIVAVVSAVGLAAAFSSAWRWGVPASYAAALAALGGGMLWRRMPSSLRMSHRRRLGRGAWAANQQADEAFEAKMDAVLERVREVGMDGLSEPERRLLAEATRRQAEREKRLGRLDRL